MAGSRPGNYGITVEGADILLRHLQREHLLGKPMRQFFANFGKIAKARAQAAAPARTGRLRASITRRMSAKRVPTFVAINVGATNRGFAYPKRLEFGPGRNKGWLKRAIESALGQIGGLLDAAGRDIEHQFTVDR